jgi:CheY-like chemotaxis protein
MPADLHRISVTPPATPPSVVFLGFSAFERNALSAYNRLSAAEPTGAFRVVDALDGADFVIVDGDDLGAVNRVQAGGRAGDAIFVGAQAPEGALGWMMRPMDALQVYRELQAAALARAQARVQGPAPGHSPPGGFAAEPPSGFGALGPPSQIGNDPHTITRTDPNPRQRLGDERPAVRALLVDDSDIALRFLQRLLYGIGVRSESATHSGRALEIAEALQPDVVFVDVELGPTSELDGFALCQRLKQLRNAQGAPLKVVMITAHTAASDRVKGTFVGCDAYLAKPADEDTLRRTLRDLGLMERGLLPRRRHRTDFSNSRTGVPEE